MSRDDCGWGVPELSSTTVLATSRYDVAELLQLLDGSSAASLIATQDAPADASYS